MNEGRYMHLLGAAEMRELRWSLEILWEPREQVLHHWYALYCEHFGDSRALSRPDFFDLYRRDLEAVVQNLLQEDFEGFERDVRQVGLSLAERGVPFAELVISLHLFEESAWRCFAALASKEQISPRLHAVFDKLSHCRLVLLAESYYEGRRADMGARLRSLEREAETLAGGPAGRENFHGLVGKSAAMREVYRQIAAVAPSQGTVFIVGESGTGKELVARALHERSTASEGPFIPVNCAALPKELLEAELFGHKRGAYTGAQSESLGLIRAAAGGTLFLDEITEMASEAQAKLLRVIEERAVRPVGTTQELPVNVRFAASTNRDPHKAVEAGLLRQDLWHRLNVHLILLPPLRERSDDVAPLSDHFLDLFARRGFRRVTGLAADALEALTSYTWPGNVRELKNALQHALTLGTDTTITRACLPAHIGRTLGKTRPGQRPTAPLPSLEEAERELIERALVATGGNKTEAARMLRISRHRLYDRLRK